MDITAATPLLGGLTPRQFMRRHWQKKPLLVRQAVPGGRTVVGRAQLFDMVTQEEVESRLIVRTGERYAVRKGPMPRSALPSASRPGWTLLVQGLDLHLPSARALLDVFRFVPDARLDDLMISWASDGGGVGPHVDSYDVFLLQTEGRRRWRVGRVATPRLVPDAPLKLLADFEPDMEWLLEPGDMLYLPPGWGHDGVAEGPCTTCSIGYRAAGRQELAHDVLQRLLDATDVEDPGPLYRDPRQPATERPGEVPTALRDHAAEGVRRLLADPQALACALGELLSEPKRGVWFDPPEHPAFAEGEGLVLDARSRMLYDGSHVYINGEAFRAGGRDATLMRRLADRRALTSVECARLSDEARDLLNEWLAAGWLHSASLETPS